MVYCKNLNLTFLSYSQAEKYLYDNYNIICSHASISQVCRGNCNHAGYYADTKQPAYLQFVQLEEPFIFLRDPFCFTYND